MMPPSFLPSHASREALHRLHVIVFNLGRRRLPTKIHRLQRLPEPTGLLCEFTVSTDIFPLSSTIRLRALTNFTAEPASTSPPAMAPPRPQLLPLASEPISVLSALLGVEQA